MGRYFGTDGIRGQANRTLTMEQVYRTGRYLGHYYHEEGKAKILIGKDTRLSSSMFEHMLAAGLSASGADVYLLGYCSTPCLAYVTMKDAFSCGIMISASHNPFYDNGVKVFGNNGLKIDDKIEGLIEDYIDDPTGIPYRINEEIGKIVEYPEGIREYQKWLLDLYPSDLSGFTVLADLANGSNCFTAKDVLNATGAKVTYINDDPDGININTHCGSTHLESLKEGMAKGDYDFGFAFDGDADRVLFLDHDGNLVDGDRMMYFLGKCLKEKGMLTGNTVVTTVMSNIGLYKALEEEGIAYDVTPVGDKNVADSMIRNDFAIGGEDSGHIILKHDSMFGDGLKTALFVMEGLKRHGCTLKEAVSGMKKYPQLLVNVRVKDKKIVLNDETLKKKLDEVAKALEGNGRILVRPSGTQPLIRVMVEAESDEICAHYVYDVIDLIKELGYAES